MAVNAKWTTIEGGLTNTFPLSINRTTYWTALRRGECDFQDMVQRVQRGILSYEQTPLPSPECFVKILDSTLSGELPDAVNSVSHYTRKWTVEGTLLKYGPIGGADPDQSINFNDDGDNSIRLVAFASNGTVFVLKNNCGYSITGTNLATDNWVRSSPNYGIGTDLARGVIDNTCYTTNAIYENSVLLVFNKRHYLWNGEGSPVELSSDIRGIAEDLDVRSGLINWLEELLFVGPIAYDLREKRVFHYSGANVSRITTRPYYAPDYRPLTIYKMAFICDGREGSFDASIEYGQSADNLSRTKTFRVTIRKNSKQRFRHLWILDLPIVCRVWRVRIENLTGCGIAQIDAYSSASTSPDDADGTE